MNLLKRESKKQISKNLKIQIENNRILRENFRKEQNINTALLTENRMLKEQIIKLKDNVRILSKDNQELAKMINELIIKCDVKLSTGEKPKARRESKKKGE